MTQQTTQVMDHLPNIEEPKLTQTQERIYRLLKGRNEPLRPKTIAKLLDLSYDSVRARLHELKEMNLIYQPLKKMTIGELDISGTINSSNVKCSYTARK